MEPRCAQHQLMPANGVDRTICDLVRSKFASWCVGESDGHWSSHGLISRRTDMSASTNPKRYEGFMGYRLWFLVENLNFTPFVDCASSVTPYRPLGSPATLNFPLTSTGTSC